MPRNRVASAAHSVAIPSPARPPWPCLTPSPPTTYSPNPIPLSPPPPPAAPAPGVPVCHPPAPNTLLADGEGFAPRLTAGLRDLASRSDIIGEVRGRGAMVAAELVQPGTGATTKEPNAAAVSKLIAHAASHGVLLLSAGTWGNVLRFLPSLVMSNELVDDGLEVLRDGFATL